VVQIEKNSKYPALYFGKIDEKSLDDELAENVNQTFCVLFSSVLCGTVNRSRLTCP